MENIQAGEYKFKTGLQQCTREFIDNCLKKNPRNRFSSEDIIRHEFFDEVRPFYSIKGTPFEINSQEEI
jgi:serine/threonine protein kinase